MQHTLLSIDHNDASDYTHVAKTSMQAGQLSQALISYTQALQQDPYNVETHLRIAVIYRRQNKFIEAIASYGIALTLQPRNATIHLCLGNIHSLLYKQGDASHCKCAIKHYNEAIKINPKLGFSVFIRRASAHLFAKNFTAAVADATQAIRLRPTRNAFVLRSLAKINMNKFAEAIVDLTKVIKLRPSRKAFEIRGLTYFKMGHFTEAIADLTEVIKLRPDGNALLSRAQIYMHLNDFDAAMRDVQEAFNLCPSSRNVACRANVFLKQGRLAEAIDSASEAIRLDRTNSSAYEIRGKAYIQNGQYAAAIIDFDKTLTLNAKSAIVYTDRGRAHHLLRNFTLAIADYTSAIELNPSTIELYYLRAYCCLEQGSLIAALQDYADAPTATNSWEEKVKKNFEEALTKLSLEQIYDAISHLPKKQAVCLIKEIFNQQTFLAQIFQRKWYEFFSNKSYLQQFKDLWDKLHTGEVAVRQAARIIAQGCRDEENKGDKFAFFQAMPPEIALHIATKVTDELTTQEACSVANSSFGHLNAPRPS